MNNKIRPMIYQVNRKMELLHKDNYKGYNYYILNLGTHPTAYIEIPEKNKLYGENYDNIDLNVHGGLTYSDNELMGIKSKNWFIGWDYAHAGDYMGFYKNVDLRLKNINDKKWTTKEIIKECKDAIDQLIDILKEE